MPQHTPAMLVLADGTVFRGISIGAPGQTVGEVVFNTSMTGYQEILTDPSYTKQIVTLTYPHIGNTGVNAEDVESGKVYASGLIIRDLPLVSSNWRSEQTLAEYLTANGVVAIADIDTRKLTRILREKGAQAGCIIAGNINEAEALAQAKAFPGLSGMDLAKVVTVDRAYEFTEGEWDLVEGYSKPSNSQFNVVAFDYGVKRNILRMLTSRGCKVTVLPAQATAEDALALKPDGVFLSNGPGDPSTMDSVVETVREVLAADIPIFGICFGHQILGRALGFETYKLQFGHRGINQPVLDKLTGKVEITAHNHGFAIKAPADGIFTTVYGRGEVTHIGLNDGVVEGLRLIDKPAFSVQYHPEAAAGPHDANYLFDRFVDLMEEKAK